MRVEERESKGRMKVSTSWTLKKLGCDGVVDGHGLAATFDVYADRLGGLKFLIDLKCFVGTVDVVAVDLLNDVAIANANLGVERARSNGEKLKADGFSAFKGGHDPSHGGEF